jgi:uncharacterized protein (DUF1015 family)
VAEIAPFRALRYNLELVGRIEDVVTPPYDVINPRQQDLYYAASPYNIIRLELNKRLPTDNGNDNPARRAGELLRRWRAEGVLKRDPRPSLYYCETEYDAEGERRCRQGFIGVVRAEEFGGAVRRHELTFSGVKVGRLHLIRECQANLSPVFGLYDDPSRRAVTALAACAKGSPELDFTDDGGSRHRFWRVDDPAALREATEVLRESVIVVADGHHRYETAVAFAQEMRSRFPEAPPEAPFNYVMMYLCDSGAPGLTVLPAHRVLAPPAGFSLDDFERRAADYFDLVRFPQEGQGEFLAALKANGASAKSSIGLYAGPGEDYRLLRLKEGVMAGPVGEDLPQPLRRLDVIVFGRLVLERLLGLPGDENEGLIQYIPDTAQALEAAGSTGRLAFLLNATPVWQVQEVARHSLTMPRKSTYFHPKAVSGLTIHPLDYPDPAI